ncbi:hypothetical protein ACFLX5_05910, partial [Chloroflexota bacterium]
MEHLYVFIDISGNWDFSDKGTRNLVLTSVMCTDVDPGILDLYRLKHDVISGGTDIEYYHAAEDRQEVRNRVFDVISNLSNVRVDSVVVEKRKAAPSIRLLNRFYPMMIEKLLKYPFAPQGTDVRRFDKVFIFMDRESDSRNEREALE